MNIANYSKFSLSCSNEYLKKGQGYSRGSSSNSLNLLHNRVDYTLQFFQLCVVLLSCCVIVTFKPLSGFLNLSFYCASALSADLFPDFLVIQSSLQVESIALKTFLSFDLLSNRLSLLFVYFGFCNHSLNIFLA